MITRIIVALVLLGNPPVLPQENPGEIGPDIGGKGADHRQEHKTMIFAAPTLLLLVEILPAF